MRPLMLRTVLAATDLSDDDIPALRTALRLARLCDARVHVAHAGDSRDNTLPRTLERHIRAAAGDSTPPPDITIRPEPAERALVDAAQAIDADVIVLGPHRPGRSRSPGGTAYRVVASSERTCLVLPGEMRLPLGRVLVPIDASGAARGALAMALTWASALRRRRPQPPDQATELVILHVEDHARPDDPSAHEVIEAAVAAVSGRMADIAGVRVSHVSDQGSDAAACILDRAESGDFDLTVLGTRAALGTAAELGSVASAVIGAAKGPLLLVPPRVWHESDDAPPA
jgi:nucleotide-binding universal stress UspA family protein